MDGWMDGWMNEVVAVEEAVAAVTFLNISSILNMRYPEHFNCQLPASILS
jgi:hypothetical protein